MKDQLENLNRSVSNIETTIGELIETVTNIARESCKSDEEGYELATMVINDLLKNRMIRSME